MILWKTHSSLSSWRQNLTANEIVFIKHDLSCSCEKTQDLYQQKFKLSVCVASALNKKHFHVALCLKCFYPHFRIHILRLFTASSWISLWLYLHFFIPPEQALPLFLQLDMSILGQQAFFFFWLILTNCTVFLCLPRSSICPPLFNFCVIIFNFNFIWFSHEKEFYSIIYKTDISQNKKLKCISQETKKKCSKMVWSLFKLFAIFKMLFPLRQKLHPLLYSSPQPLWIVWSTHTHVQLPQV